MLEQGREEWVGSGWGELMLCTRNSLCKGPMESAGGKLSVVWVGGRGQEEEGRGSKKDRTIKKTGEVG